MTTIVWNELLDAFKSFLMQPLLYWMIFFTYMQHKESVKQMELQFRYTLPRLFYFFQKNMLFSITAGVLISTFTLVTGVTVTCEFIAIVVIVIFLLSVAFKNVLLSASFSLGISYFIFVELLPKNSVNYFEITPLALVSLTFLTGLFLFLEAMMFLRLKNENAYPVLRLSKRGKWYVEHLYNTTMMIPVFFLVPDGAITLHTHYWPFFSIGANSYQLFLFPFMIGLSKTFRRNVPETSMHEQGKRLIVLSIAVIMFSFASLVVPALTPYVFLFAMSGRLVLSLIVIWKEKRRSPMFIDDEEKVTIAHVMPHSPAAKLGFQAGDKFVRVGENEISTVAELDQMIASNNGLCTFELIDLNNQKKVVENTFALGDRLQLGIIVATAPANIKQHAADIS